VNDGEVLVQIKAAGVNMADVDYLQGRPSLARVATGLRGPKNHALGLDVAGSVQTVGKDVTRFKTGDEVFGDLTDYGFGAFAEYVAAPEAAFAPKPPSLTFEQAATVPQAGVMAVPGDKVLINGAGGNIGPFAVQIAKSFEAEVTGVDSAKKFDMMRSLGADHVIDYTQVDYAQQGQRYDWILDVAAHRSVFESRRALGPSGVYVMVPATMPDAFQSMVVGPLISIGSGRKIGMLPWKPMKQDDVAFLTELIEAGKVSPVIDRRYPLSEASEAIRYQEEGHPVGKIVITV